jgi:hypothetical protein
MSRAPTDLKLAGTQAEAMLDAVFLRARELLSSAWRRG